MAIRSITVSELKWACLDPQWRARWIAGHKPSTKHLPPPGSHAVGGAQFHALAQRFAKFLTTSVKKRAALATEADLWAALYRQFAERQLDRMAGAAKVEAALFLSGALQAFCGRLSSLRSEAAARNRFEKWSDLLLIQEHSVRDVPFPTGAGPIHVTGAIDAVRLHPRHGFEIVDYKLSRGANLRHDLCQLAIYARLLELSQPGLGFCGCLEYYLPQLDLLEVTSADLLAIFNDLVEPVLAELTGAKTRTMRREEPAKFALTPVPTSTQKPAANVKAEFDPASDPVAGKIVACFGSFKLPVSVTGRHDAPQVIRYLATPARGVKVVSLANRADDLQVALGLVQAPRIEPTADGVAIDIPKPKPDLVRWHDVAGRCGDGVVAFPVGVAVDATVITADLSDPGTCHALVAGVAGSGKSEWLKSVVATLIRRNPDAKTLRLALIDPKLLTFAGIENAPHLLCPILAQTGPVLEFLDSAVMEMERRYTLMARERFNNLRERHAAGNREIPFWVVVCDEFADLILAGGAEKQRFEAAVARLAGKGRAAGIHLILATQRPDRNIVTGLIKANLPLKVCLRVTSAVNSQIVLDDTGAEKLLGRGDLLCDTGRGIRRAQSPFVDPEEWAALGA